MRSSRKRILLETGGTETVRALDVPPGRFMLADRADEDVRVLRVALDKIQAAERLLTLCFAFDAPNELRDSIAAVQGDVRSICWLLKRQLQR